mmetsp:Transcript_10570/g.10583  ORF Transcript_10570/g.10583 Transcript_10570/m.10583 type:complete len:236 (+) Transcript_10570:772-1479(+)
MSLQTLLLDGCDGVDDHALVCLTEKFPNPRQIRLSSIDSEISGIDGTILPVDLKGGGRGLTRLSLSECRCVTDQGVAYLRKLRRLEDLSLLGCYSVVDKGIELLVKGCHSLKKINLSGTYITKEGLNFISNSCKNLEHILLHNCKLLSEDDRKIFKGVLVELREDIFRFQLLPTSDTVLGLITNNILRTRSSLTIQRVGHYVTRKLDQQNIEIDILCKGRVLSPYMTLKDVQNDM